MKILLVEDDLEIVHNLTTYLQEEGFSVISVTRQSQAVEALQKERFDLALLDIALPDGNGYAVCAAIKAVCDLPIIFVTASDDEFSVVTGLELGADDYISKPFRPRELLSRIRSVLRRSGKAQSVLEIQDVQIDTGRGIVLKGGMELFLSALEYRLLLLFFTNRGIVLSRNKLLEEIWDMAGEFVSGNTLTVYIKRLREKVETDPQNPTIIKTVRGIGYRAGD